MEKNKKKRYFFISDLHFNHKNIIRYCSRPFKDVENMNDCIIKNWNGIVDKEDVVYFLGDMTYEKTSNWLEKLNGKIIFIKGNHDMNIDIPYYDKIMIEYKGRKFLLIHNPYDIPSNFKGWIIHGHKHNNQLEKYPIINQHSKTINVSCEILNYKPIEINELIFGIR